MTSHTPSELETETDGRIRARTWHRTNTWAIGRRDSKDTCRIPPGTWIRTHPRRHQTQRRNLTCGNISETWLCAESKCLSLRLNLSTTLAGTCLQAHLGRSRFVERLDALTKVSRIIAGTWLRRSLRLKLSQSDTAGNLRRSLRLNLA